MTPPTPPVTEHRPQTADTEPAPTRPSILGKLKTLLHAPTGPLTRKLLRRPADFGLGQVPANKTPNGLARSICGYCSTGCSLDIHLLDGEAINLTPTSMYPVNLGMACPKGWEALNVLDADDRATKPLIRNAAGQLEGTDWDTALRQMVTRIREIQNKHGNESVAFLSTGQIATEEMALLGSLAKFGMGMRHGDGNTRQCMATAVTAYKQSFGFDAPPYTYADFEESDCLVFVGANPCIAHPIMWERVTRNRQKPDIIVIDPRRTETAQQATLHLPLNPKSDQHLFYAIANQLIVRGAINQSFIEAHTTGFEDFARFIADYTLESAVVETGLQIEVIEQFLHCLINRKRISFWWTMGVNQSYQGTRTAQALINLSLMTGHIGRPGTGANSITGQCNAMGSRLFSNTTNLLGGRDFENPDHREDVASILDIPVDRIPDKNSWSYPEIIEGVRTGKIKGLWVIATNPVHSWIDQNALKQMLPNLELLVVQDMYHSTETAVHADIILPAAGWGEKDGTFINSERRIGRFHKVRRAPGMALADYAIFRLVAEYWGCGDMFSKWQSPHDAFQLLKQLSQGQPCDFTGIENYESLTAAGIQWPCRSPEESQVAERRLYADGQFFHADGRARFLFESPRPLLETPSSEYPLILVTGRGSASQWHTQTRTSKSAVLRRLYPHDQYIEVHPQDVEKYQLQPHDWACVESPRGTLKARVVSTWGMRPGQVFIPMHQETTNQLTHSGFDPYSKQPSYKAAIVRISPAH